MKIGRILSIVTVLSLLLGALPVYANIGDNGWTGGFIQNGPSGYVYAMTIDGERVYYGGLFKSAGNVLATSIAAWDPVNGWQALGDGFYLKANPPSRESDTGYVFALAADGRGGLYAEGDFDTVKNGPDQPDIAVNNISHWDGAKWSAMGEGVGGAGESALAVDAFGNLYTTGYFKNNEGINTDTLSRWDGQSWTSLGGEIANQGLYGVKVTSMVISPDGYLYASGDFTSLGGGPALNVARFDLRSNQWQALGDGLGQPLSVNHYNRVEALAMDDRGNLYAGGNFTTTGTVPLENIAVWDGISWQGVGEGLEAETQRLKQPVRTLAVDGDTLYAAGDLIRSGNQTLHAIASWNRTDPADGWQPVGDEITNLDYDVFIKSMAVTRSGNLFIGGEINKAGNTPTHDAAFWDGQAWHGLGPASSIDGRIEALAEGPDGMIYAGGQFATAGPILASSIASWDPQTGEWSALGEGVTQGWLQTRVRAITVDTDGNVYVGGDFTHAGVIGANSIAEWDGQAWHALGSGLMVTDTVTTYEGDVFALIIDAQGNVIAGGYFNLAGRAPVNNVARWNGQAWEAMGDGFPPEVESLAIAPDGTIYAAGNSAVARWNGNQWQPIGGSGFMSGDKLAVDSQNLFAGDWGHISRWTGSGWQSLGNLEPAYLPSKPYLGAMVSDGQGGVYIGGEFAAIAGYPANNLAHWSAVTQSWSGLGSGVKEDEVGSVNALALASTGRLYTGGGFYRAGNQASWAFAWWKAPALLYLPFIKR